MPIKAGLILLIISWVPCRVASSTGWPGLFYLAAGL